MKNQNYFKPQRTEGVQPLSAIDSKINKKFSRSDWAHNAGDWLARQEGWEDFKPSLQQAIGAHILRIEKLSRQSTEGLTDSEKEKVEARNSRNKERLKKALIDKIIVKPEKALESELRALHNMYGHELSDNEVIENFLKSQREKLGTWIDYLDGGTGTEFYPTWFKIYVMDGVENMGRYNAEKGIYEKRSNGTVAEFPDLNPAALAKTFDVVNDFYAKNNKPKEEKELELFNSGSFNRIYSNIKNEITFSVEVPEWFGDIKGAWKEYNPGMTKELTTAAQGTPWCIEGSYMAEQYLDREDGKFYLFHLEDPETGALSETAAASIRMEQGEVAEISGVRDDSSQNIDISLLPSMIEKLDQLPGGGYYSGNLEYSLELIKGLSEKAKRDGLSHALDEIRCNIDEKIHFNEGGIIVNNLEELKKDFTLDEILANVRIKTLDPYIKAGFTAEEIFEKVNAYGLDGFKSFVKAGFDKLDVFEKVDDVSEYTFEFYVKAGIPLEEAFKKVELVDSEDFNLYVKTGVPPEEVFKKVYDIYPLEDFSSIVKAGIPLEEAFKKVELVDSKDFNLYVEAGVPPEIVFKKVGYVNSENFSFYVEAGVSPEKVFEKVNSIHPKSINFYVKAGVSPEAVFEKVKRVNLEDFGLCVEAGVSPEIVVEKVDYIYHFEDFNSIVKAGVSPEKVFEKVEYVDPEEFYFYTEAGVPPEEVFREIRKIGVEDLYYYIKAGVPPETVFKRVNVRMIHTSDFYFYVNKGIPPEIVFKKVDYVNSKDFNFYVEAGVPPEIVFKKVGYVNSENFSFYVEAGIPPKEVFKKVKSVDPIEFNFYVEAGVPEEKILERIRS